MQPIFRKRKSLLWRFFEPLDGNRAKCSTCKQNFSYRTTTSNLKKHLRKRHPLAITALTRESEGKGAIVPRKFDKSDEEYTENIKKTETHEIFINDTPDGETEEAAFIESSCRSPTSSTPNPLAREKRSVLMKEKLNRSNETVYKSAKFSSIDGERNTSQNKLSPDECDTFGKIVAAHLRQLPASVALECQSDILHHLVQKRLGKSSLDSRIHSYTSENGTEEIIVQAWENST